MKIVQSVGLQKEFFKKCGKNDDKWNYLLRSEILSTVTSSLEFVFLFLLEVRNGLMEFVLISKLYFPISL